MSKQTGLSRRAFTVRRHVVQFSGGIGSFAVAVWVARKYGTRNLTLLIADTGIEDDDLWRFADDTSRLLGVPLTKVADGRTPWEVFRDVRFLGNDRLAPCTRLLKQVPCREWMEQHADPADTLVYVGMRTIGAIGPGSRRSPGTGSPGSRVSRCAGSGSRPGPRSRRQKRWRSVAPPRS